MDVAEITKVHFEARRRGDLKPTSRELLQRMRNADDHHSWQEFFDTYWNLVYQAARKAGLSEQESEDVVQSTMISVARRMESFRYEPEKCSFKGWLMHLTRGHIIDCRRRRRTQSERFESSRLEPESSASEIPDVAAEQAFEAIWMREWRGALLKAANRRIRREVKPEHYLIYHLRCVKSLSVRDVSQRLSVNKLKIYLVQHRITKLLRIEVERLEKEATLKGV